MKYIATLILAAIAAPALAQVGSVPEPSSMALFAAAAAGAGAVGLLRKRRK